MPGMATCAPQRGPLSEKEGLKPPRDGNVLGRFDGTSCFAFRGGGSYFRCSLPIGGPFPFFVPSVQFEDTTMASSSRGVQTALQVVLALAILALTYFLYESITEPYEAVERQKELTEMKDWALEEQARPELEVHSQRQLLIVLMVDGFRHHSVEFS